MRTVLGNGGLVRDSSRPPRVAAVDKKCSFLSRAEQVNGRAVESDSSGFFSGLEPAARSD